MKLYKIFNRYLCFGVFRTSSGQLEWCRHLVAPVANGLDGKFRRAGLKQFLAQALIS